MLKPADGRPGLSEETWAKAFLQVSDGALVHYRHVGSGPAVLLCDGIGCVGFAWPYLAPLLAADHHVIHPHLRGHGSSPPPPDPTHLTIDVLADDAIQVLRALGGRDAILFGHSMGVQTCLEVYRRHPECVRALVLACGSYGSLLHNAFGLDLLHHLLPLVRLLARRRRALLRLLWRTVIPTELAYQFALRFEVNGQLVKRDDMVEYLQNLARVDPGTFLRILGYAEEHSARDLLEQVRVPVLLIGGRRDGFTPIALTREMAGRIPHAQLLEVADGTHATTLERPELIAEAVVRFIREVETPAEPFATQAGAD